MHNERSMALILREFCGWLMLILGFTGGATLLASAEAVTDGRYDRALLWLAQVGATFVSLDASWVLPTLLGMVLALYAALLGQSVTGADRAAVLRTRRRLVPAGLAASAFIVTLDVAAVIATAVGLTESARLPVLLTMSVGVILLGLLIGKFELFSHEEKVRYALEQKTRAERLIARLDAVGVRLFPSIAPEGAVRPVMIVAVPVLTSSGLVSLSVLLQWAALDVSRVTGGVVRPLMAVLAVMDILCASGGFLVPAAALLFTYQVSPAAARIAVVASRILPSAFCVPAVVVFAAFESFELLIGLLIAGLVPAGFAYGTLFARLVWAPGWLQRLAMRYIIFATACRDAEKVKARAERTIAALEAAPMRPEGSTTHD